MPEFIIDKDLYDIFEGMTSISSVISSIENHISQRKILKVFYNADKKKSKYNELKFLDIKSKELGFELIPASHTTIDELANGKTHGGIIAICSKVAMPILTNPNQIIDNGFYIVLDGIEDPFNFAYAIRSVYASGADGVIVPTYRFNNAQGLICKGSAGTSELIDIFECDILNAIDIFKSKGYKVASAGIRDSVSLYDADLKKPLLLIVGGEKRGISSEVLAKSDMVVRVDYGKTFKGSLTASSAATVLAFEVYRQNR
ncbi:MAG: RNA methyltransferase [Clostridia bacterium]|nr:RNA methyltransferase [Clostridia bacterium]